MNGLEGVTEEQRPTHEFPWVTRDPVQNSPSIHMGSDQRWRDGAWHRAPPET